MSAAVAVLLVALCGASERALAQDRPWMSPNAHDHIDGGGFIGVSTGSGVSPAFGARAEFEIVDRVAFEGSVTFRHPAPGLSCVSLGSAVLIRLASDTHAFVPYLVVGSGAMRTSGPSHDPERDVLLQAGGGAKIVISQRVDVRPDVRALIGVGSTHYHRAVMVSVAVHFRVW